MNDSKKESFLSKINIFKKIKLSKNVSIAIAIILGLIGILIFASSFDSEKVGSENTNDETLISMREYTKEMESKLKTLIMAVDGVESAEVMITFESSVELVISSTKETKTVSSGSSETKVVVETPVLVTEKGVTKPIILQEKLPEPKSVFVVVSSVKDTKVKLDIIRAIEVLFALPSSKIEVLVGK